MSVSTVFRLAFTLGCVLPTTFAFSQDLPTNPPATDATYWGRANVPYVLKITVTSTGVSANSAPHTHVMVTNVFRDSEGIVREESTYDNGRPMAVSIRDPHKMTNTIMYVAQKNAVIAPLYPPQANPPAGKGWTVERLPSRVIDGMTTDGLRFTRTFPDPTDKSGTPVTMVEEDWISDKLGVVLEQTTYNSHTGRTTKTVSEFQQVEPDPALFKIDLSGYSVQEVGTSAH